jgi:hypothetical protein
MIVTHISNTKHSLLVRRQHVCIKLTTYFLVVIVGAKRQYCKRVKNDVSEGRLAATKAVSPAAAHSIGDLN